MAVLSCPELEYCLEFYAGADTAALNLTRLTQARELAALLPLYDQAIPLVEAAMWESALAPEQVGHYHALFAEMESLIAAAGDDSRYRLVVVVPVADRPQHLRVCLESLAGFVRAFSHGPDRLTVVIADDSCDVENIAENRAIATGISRQGIETVYFGIEEQRSELEGLAVEDRQALQNIVGNSEAGAFCHKGASVMRNITCLMLNRMAQLEKNLLFLFVDSDQEFHANTGTGCTVFTTNYFYHIDYIFRHSQVEVLTGKVVGDPPVSPAVMAGNLLKDVLAFFTGISDLAADTPCTFHQDSTGTGDAAYHDMAALFGFKSPGKPQRYQCHLQGAHDHAACLSGFARRLNHFFDGVHPTRETPYQHVDVQASLAPARTVYTGNYVLSPGALKYFIPFAGLQLRMAGPVLGRLIQASCGENFVSVNLPLLHRRTLEAAGMSEFRPGVDRSARLVDLSGEFERQFFGDVMLFTVIDLVDQDYPQTLPGHEDMHAGVMATERRMREQYAETQQNVSGLLGEFETCLSEAGHWWNGGQQAEISSLLRQFAKSMLANYGRDAHAWQFIDDEAHREIRCAAIVDALLSYPDDCESWVRALKASASCQQSPSLRGTQ